MYLDNKYFISPRVLPLLADIYQQYRTVQYSWFNFAESPHRITWKISTKPSTIETDAAAYFNAWDGEQFGKWCERIVSAARQRTWDNCVAVRRVQLAVCINDPHNYSQYRLGLVASLSWLPSRVEHDWGLFILLWILIMLR